MNKKLISAAVLVGLAGSATAVNVNPDGMGQVLLYPYYTTNGGKFTNVQIVNTTKHVKAVKVRFSEGVNTWEVLDFNLYLSPWDVWTGVVVQDENGKPMLKTQDTSCTVPAIPAAGEHLRDGNIVTYANETTEVTKLTAAERLTEGHLEVIEMGEVDGSTAATGLVLPRINLATAATHNAEGVPNDCSALSSAWLSGEWSKDSRKGMMSPKGGLFGMAEIIDVAQGTDRGYDAVAIDGFFDPAKNGGIAHSLPGNSFPNLNGEMIPANNVGGSLEVGNKKSVVYKDGQAVVSEWDHTIDALSAALSVETVSNVYYVGDSLAAATDWVISFPTKHYYVNKDTARLKSGQRGAAAAPGTVPVVDPVTGLTTTNSSWMYRAPFSAGFGVTVAMSPFDREEKGQTLSLDFSPSITSTNELVNEVNVIEFAKSRSVFDSKLANNIGIQFDGGWAQLNFATGVMKSKEGHVYNGLPAIGFASTKVVNGNVDGSLANYAVLYNHKYTRHISSK